MNATKRPAQHADETAMEYLRRIVGWVNYEEEWMLDQLPSVDAVVEFFEVWQAYGTDFWAGVLECIAEGDDPEPARAFVRKWKLGKEWMKTPNLWRCDGRKRSPKRNSLSNVATELARRSTRLVHSVVA